jgi:hypothetical protein
MIVKAVNGCAFSGNYWSLCRRPRNVEVTLTVTDTQTARSDLHEPVERRVPADPGHLRVRRLSVTPARRTPQAPPADGGKKSRTAAITASTSSSDRPGNIGSETLVRAIASAPGSDGGAPRNAIAGWRWLAIG